MKTARLLLMLMAVAWTVLAIVTGGCASREPLVHEDGTPNGRAIYEQRCAQCHALYQPQDFSDQQWARNVATFASRAGIRPAWRAAVLNYLQSSNDDSAPAAGTR